MGTYGVTQLVGTTRKSFRQSHGLRLLPVVLLVFAAALTFTAVASALVHERVGTFSEISGTATQPTLGEPSGMAFDPSGNLVVIDLSDRTLNRFDAEGHPVNFSALSSTNVIDGHAGEEDATPQGEILSTEVAGESIEAEVAIAPSGATAGTAGNIYVTDAFHEAVDVFDSTGKYIGQITSAGYACGVAVDAAGNLYVGDWYGEIHKFAPTATPGTFTNTANWGVTSTTVPHPCTLAAGAQPLASGGSEGFIFAINLFAGEEVVTKIDASTGEAAYVVDSSGTNAGLAVDPAAGRLYVAGGPAIKEYDVSGSSKATETSRISLADSARGVAVDAATGNVYVTRDGEAHVEVWGPPRPGPPKVEGPVTLSAGSEEATVSANVNPEGAPTSFHIEYVDEASFESEGGFASIHTQTTPEQATGFEDSEAHQVTATLSGLNPHTAYRWRLVATNSCSGSCGTTNGPTVRFVTHSLASGLLDNRAYEMVSPLQKNSAEVAVPNSAGTGFGQSLTVIPIQASSSGGAIAYATTTAFGPDPESAPLYSEYLSVRGATGWSTENINPKFEEGYTRDPLVGFSSDLSHGTVIAVEPPLTSDATPGFPNLYSRDNRNGTLAAVTTTFNTPELDPGTSKYCLSYGGSSTDFHRIFFAAMGALIPGDPLAPDGVNLYEWSDERPAGDRVHLVSILPSGDAAQAATRNGYGRGPGILVTCDMRPQLARHAISEDGSHAVWTSGESFFEVQPGEFANEPLMDRVNGTETVQLDAKQGGSAPYSGEGKYWDASIDGSKVFFTDGLALTPEANGIDLYRYNFDAAPGTRLENLTAHSPEAADVQGVLGASSDGSSVYFVAKGLLDGTANQHGEEATAGANNLYVWAAGAIHFIATLAPADSSAWSSNPEAQDARVAPDGGHLAFASIKSLTGFENQSNREVFVFDASDDELLCASCNPTGAAVIGPSDLPGWSTPYEQRRYLSDDGKRLFFESNDALAAQDTNGKQDVYEWEAQGAGTCSGSAPSFSAESQGCIALISGGTDSSDSYFLDASGTGDDVFITTRQRLVPQDTDERYDIYDARVGGGFPFSPPVVTCQADEVCRGTGTSRGTSPSVVTSRGIRSGDPRPKRHCPKGKRRVKRHGKVRCVRRRHHHKKQTRQHANTDRRAGK
jgi:hypothetical protein